VAAFLRVINALENIREAQSLLQRSAEPRIGHERAMRLVTRAGFETDDARRVLEEGDLHPEALPHLRAAKSFIDRAACLWRRSNVRKAAAELEAARAELVDVD
jgi:hypothetical protein